MPRVHAVTSIVSHYTVNEVPFLVLSATGVASSGGWSDFVLKPLWQTGEASPADGVWAFEFVGNAPTEPAIQRLTPIAASQVRPYMAIPPAWVKIIRVLAASDQTEIDLGQTAGNAALRAKKAGEAGAGPRDGHGDLRTGVDYFPFLEHVLRAGGVDLFPWSHTMATKVAKAVGDDAADAAVDATKHQDLVGKTLRVYQDGDAVTMDFRTDRINFALARGTQRIVRVSAG